MNKHRNFVMWSGRAAALLAVCLLAASTTSCRKVYRVEQAGAAARPQQVDLTAAQAISVKQEMESIEAFVARSGWNMQQSGPGLWYEIYGEAAAGAQKVEYGDAVKVAYTLRLLNGSVIEEYTAERPRTWILGKSEMTAGLSEALMMLKKGNKAR
ncbi:MAG: FKBP-type peptidyl-prolyl cis-trans isomerase, partial [Bacteroidales bacterium]|nr:FKBP-type peptidyl-prolyl cis-trans isomerase [Bacteroidales bacterium]